MKFIKLTAANGAPVWINKDSVDRFVTASKDTAAPGGTVVLAGDAEEVVKEPPTAVLALLEAVAERIVT